MIERLRQHWHEFKASKPGQRYQDRYHRHQQSSDGHFALRIFNVVAGIALALASIAFWPAPVFGLGTFLIALIMIASELLPVAKFLDWAELRLRKLARWARDVWKSAPPAGKALMVLAILIFVSAFGYGVYSYLLFGG